MTITITYPKGGAHDGYAEVHATGCAHTFRRSRYRDPFVTDDLAFGPDDFAYIAPCAKGLPVTFGGEAWDAKFPPNTSPQ